ncbi:MAG TPA: biotin/lipoyl-containing protein, partial [Chitinophagaceae bacterium]|nr:biotin/lipoyl-containing protein [Chitinophagaceae bacterium]
MAEVILMPRLSDTMTEGVIAEWHKKVGDPVKKGDLLAEVETDKATMELESYKDGTLLYIGVDKGGKLQVNDLLAIIGSKGEDISAIIKGGDQRSQTFKPDREAKKSMAGNNQSAASQQQATATIDLSKMEEVVLMPRLSDTMTEGVIAAWHKNVGDTVKKGEVLAEIETDKATMELESYKNGKLLYIGAKNGEKIAVNALLCIIGEEGKVNVNAIVEAAKAGEGLRPEVVTQKTEAGVQKSMVETVSNSSLGDGSNGRLKASPLAKKLAAEKGIDINKIHGSGDGG